MSTPTDVQPSLEESLISQGSEHPITNPPSSELVADSYDDNVKVYLCILTSENIKPHVEADVAELIEALRHCGYEPKRKDFLTKTELEEFLEETKTFSSAVLMFWFGESFENSFDYKFELDSKDRGQNKIRELWKPIVFNEKLKEKPKIIMFFSYVPIRIPQLDNKNQMVPDTKIANLEYDSPIEADVLLVLQTTDIDNLSETEESKKTFVQILSKQMEELCEIHHLSNIVCLSDIYTPIIISTLTKKFYLKESSNTFRGLQHQLHKSLTDLAAKTLNHEVPSAITTDILA